MKVLNCYNESDFRIEEMEEPAISDREMLIEMLYCGLCGSDVIKIFDQSLKKPDIYGHEIIGRVVGKGSSVKKFEIGDTVVAAHHIPCGTCQFCIHGNHSMCAHFKETNIVPGGFSQYIKLSEEHIDNTTFKLPGNFDLLNALFIEPLACCIRAMDRIDRLPYDVFSVTGAGTIGILFLQLIKMEELQAVVIDLDSPRLDLAKKLGADLVINPADSSPDNNPALKNTVQSNFPSCNSSSDPIKGLHEDLYKKQYKSSVSENIKNIFQAGVDAAILTVTNKNTIYDALSYIRAGGSINIFGIAEKTSTISLDFGKIYKNELTIKSTYSATPDTLSRAYDLIISGRINVSCLISGVMPLSDFKKGLDMMLERKIYKAIYRL